jgi:flagellar protein FliO/FliZ
MRLALLALAAAGALSVPAPRAAAADDHPDAYYGASHAAEAPYRPGSSMGPATAVAVLCLAGAGAWLLVRGRKIQLPGRSPRRLSIDETRSLGSRQYLVVASYDGKKLLLGVCPGRIDLLTALDAGAPSDRPQ